MSGWRYGCRPSCAVRGQVLTVEGDELHVVRGALGETIEGAATRHIGRVDDPRSGEVFAYGDYTVAAGESVRVRAERSIVLECGESSIELTPEGIRLRGRDVRTIGTELASIQSRGDGGPALVVTDQIELTAKEMHLFGESSRLSLTREADLTRDTKTVVVGGGAGLGLAGGATLAGGKVISRGRAPPWSSTPRPSSTARWSSSTAEVQAVASAQRIAIRGCSTRPGTARPRS